MFDKKLNYMFDKKLKNMVLENQQKIDQLENLINELLELLDITQEDYITEEFKWSVNDNYREVVVNKVVKQRLVKRSKNHK